MASIRPRGGKWQARVIRQGQTPQAKTFLKKQDAERWARSVEADIERGVSAPQPVPPAGTLGELLARYRAEVVPAFKGAKEDVIRLRAIERVSVCRTPLASLTPAHVAAYAQVRAGTVIRELAYVSSAINHARREWGLAIENPVSLVRKPAAPRGRERLLSRPELEKRHAPW